MRNPWGKKEWLGDWSDYSSKWTPDIRFSVGHMNKEDGVFFISIEDYMKYFESTSICAVQDFSIRKILRSKSLKGQGKLF